MESVLSFHHVDPRDGARVIRLGSKCPCSQSHLASSAVFCFLSVNLHFVHLIYDPNQNDSNALI